MLLDKTGRKLRGDSTSNCESYKIKAYAWDPGGMVLGIGCPARGCVLRTTSKGIERERKTKGERDRGWEYSRDPAAICVAGTLINHLNVTQVGSLESRVPWSLFLKPLFSLLSPVRFVRGYATQTNRHLVQFALSWHLSNFIYICRQAAKYPQISFVFSLSVFVLNSCFFITFSLHRRLDVLRT